MLHVYCWQTISMSNRKWVNQHFFCETVTSYKQRVSHSIVHSVGQCNQSHITLWPSGSEQQHYLVSLACHIIPCFPGCECHCTLLASSLMGNRMYVISYWDCVQDDHRANRLCVTIHCLVALIGISYHPKQAVGGTYIFSSHSYSQLAIGSKWHSTIFWYACHYEPFRQWVRLHAPFCGFIIVKIRKSVLHYALFSSHCFTPILIQ